MLLRTEVSEKLAAAGAEIVVLTPNAGEAYFRDELRDEGFSLVQTPERYPTIEKAVVNIRGYALMNPSLGGTLHYKRERYRRLYPARARVARAMNLVLGRYGVFRKAYLALESRAFSGREFDSVLRAVRPDLVVTGTPGFVILDAHLLRAARRAGVPTATVMLSWDNLTSKGYMSAQPDHLLVWSDLMRDEAIRYHNFEGTIVEVGAPQFDVYPRVRARLDVAEFRRRHGVPEGVPLVVWGTINNDIYPNQLDLLRRFVHTLENQGRGDKFVWVRVHPQTVSGVHRDLTAAYKELESDRVRIELPQVQSEKLLWDLPKSDMVHLAELMTAADVVVTPQSTLTIDAACAGTPVVNVATDPAFALTYKYTHYQSVMRNDASWVVYSFDELMRAVDECIADRGNRETGRRALVEEQLGRYYGRAGDRVASVLLELAGRPEGVGEWARTETRAPRFSPRSTR